MKSYSKTTTYFVLAVITFALSFMFSVMAGLVQGAGPVEFFFGASMVLTLVAAVILAVCGLEVFFNTEPAD